MPRFNRDMLFLAKAETTYGTDSVPTAADNSMLIREGFEIVPLETNNVPRNLLLPYLGGSEELVGTVNATMTGEVELVGSGTAGTAPAWAPLLEACAMEGAAEASTRYDFLPITNDQASYTSYVHDSGVRHIVRGVRSNATLRLRSGEAPVMAIEGRGLYSAITAVAQPTDSDFSAFMTPQVPNDAQTLDIVLGGALSETGAVAITGGTPVPSLGIEVNLGNDVQFVPLIGGETVDVVQRAVAGSIQLDLTAAQEVSRIAEVLAATLTSIAIIHGTVTGRRVALYLPSVQLINPRKSEFNGRRLISFDFRGVPTPGGAGNDELRVVTSF